MSAEWAISDLEAMRIFQPRRALVGFCPECDRLTVLHNDGEVWPPGACACGWSGDSLQLVDRVRFEWGAHVGGRKVTR